MKAMALVTLATLSLGAEALACGGWTLEDRELAAQVTFLASTVYVQPRGGARKDVIRIDDDGTSAGVRSFPVGWKEYTPPAALHRFEGSALFARDRRVGELRDGGFTIHGRAYEVTTTLVPPGTGANVGPLGTEPAWIVDVTTGGTTILSGLGRSLCPDGARAPSKVAVARSDAVSEELVRRRVAVYLASTRAEVTKPSDAPAVTPAKP